MAELLLLLFAHRCLAAACCEAAFVSGTWWALAAACATAAAWATDATADAVADGDEMDDLHKGLLPSRPRPLPPAAREAIDLALFQHPREPLLLLQLVVLLFLVVILLVVFLRLCVAMLGAWSAAVSAAA